MCSQKCAWDDSQRVDLGCLGCNWGLKLGFFMEKNTTDLPPKGSFLGREMRPLISANDNLARYQ